MITRYHHLTLADSREINNYNVLQCETVYDTVQEEKCESKYDTKCETQYEVRLKLTYYSMESSL